MLAMVRRGHFEAALLLMRVVGDPHTASKVQKLAKVLSIQRLECRPKMQK
jgi:hypothetical protein